MSEKLRNNKKKIIYAGVITVFVLLFVIGICILTLSGSRLSRQLDLGYKYLEEMDYEQAVIAFNRVIEIDPRNTDAYLGLVEVYIRTGELDTALEYAQKGYEATGDERLKEKIEMIESGNITASNGWRIKESTYDGNGRMIFYWLYSYDLQGRVNSIVAYKPDDSVADKVEMQYDENGNQIEGWASFSHDTLLFATCKSEYDSEGKLIHKVGYDESGVYDYDKYFEYDSDGKLIRENREFKDENNIYLLYQYDESGKKIKESIYSESDELEKYEIYEYDENGNNIQRNEYNADGSIMHYEVYEHDKNGEIIHSRYYDADGSLISESYYE